MRAVTVRRAQVPDAGAITDIYNEAIATTTATFDTEPKTAEERVQWLHSHDERHPVLVAELAGKVVGWASITRGSDRPGYRDTAETSLYVHSTQRGCGVGRKLQDALIDQARQLGFHSLIARVSEGSAQSLHLHQTTGFTQVGVLKEVGRKFGRVLDVHILQKMLD